MDSIMRQITEDISNANTLEELAKVRSHYLGIGSKINEDIKTVGNYTTMSERTNVYQLIVDTRNLISKLIDTKHKILINNKLAA